MTDDIPHEIFNDLWLHARSATMRFDELLGESRQVDRLIRTALVIDDDVELIAEKSFLDANLVRHVADGGTTFAFLLRTADPG